ncbi:MAG TPA: hypothetical protein VF092_04525 [Longimicrobium sp.]
MPDTPIDPTLDDVLVALQKSFSRVSARSADLPADAARALVVGKVNFDIGLKTNIIADRLVVNAGGAIELKLSGTIQQDIREVASPPAGETTPMPDVPPAPPPADQPDAPIPADASPAPDGPGAASDEAMGGPLPVA